MNIYVQFQFHGVQTPLKVIVIISYCRPALCRCIVLH